MGWLRLAGSIKLYVSFAKKTYKRHNILQKRAIILSILLTVATPYAYTTCICSCMCECVLCELSVCGGERGGGRNLGGRAVYLLCRHRSRPDIFGQLLTDNCMTLTCHVYTHTYTYIQFRTYVEMSHVIYTLTYVCIYVYTVTYITSTSGCIHIDQICGSKFGAVECLLLVGSMKTCLRL